MFLYVSCWRSWETHSLSFWWFLFTWLQFLLNSYRTIKKFANILFMLKILFRWNFKWNTLLKYLRSQASLYCIYSKESGQGRNKLFLIKQTSCFNSKLLFGSLVATYFRSDFRYSPGILPSELGAINFNGFN